MRCGWNPQVTTACWFQAFFYHSRNSAYQVCSATISTEVGLQLTSGAWRTSSRFFRSHASLGMFRSFLMLTGSAKNSLAARVPQVVVPARDNWSAGLGIEKPADDRIVFRDRAA